MPESNQQTRRDRLARAYQSLEGLCCGDAFGERFFIPDGVALSLIDQRVAPAPPCLRRPSPSARLGGSSAEVGSERSQKIASVRVRQPSTPIDERERSLVVRVGPSYATSAVALFFVVYSCVACARVAHGTHSRVPAEQELISPAVTILPAGKPVHVRLLQNLNTHKSVTMENVPFQVTSNVRVGDLTVIAKGTSVLGRAFITSPDGFARKAQIYLVLGSTSAVTGTQIPLGGILNEMGGSCGPSFLDCLRDEGGHAAVGDGTEIEAFVAENVSLSTQQLQAFAQEKRRIAAQVLGDHQLQMRVHIYRLPTGGAAHARVTFDGRKIANLGPGQDLVLVPSPGKHIVAVNKDSLELELVPYGQYYVRIFQTGSWPKTKAHLKLVAPDEGQDDVTDLVGVPADRH